MNRGAFGAAIFTLLVIPCAIGCRSEPPKRKQPQTQVPNFFPTPTPFPGATPLTSKLQAVPGMIQNGISTVSADTGAAIDSATQSLKNLSDDVSRSVKDTAADTERRVHQAARDLESTVANAEQDARKFVNDIIASNR